MNPETPPTSSAAVKIHADYLQHAQTSFLKTEQLEDFVAACNRPLRPSIRYNRLKINLQQFEQIAAKYGWQLQAIPWCPEGFWITPINNAALDKNVEQPAMLDSSLGNLAEHVQGLFYIQEASSMLPPQALLSNWQEQLALSAENNTAPLVMDMAAAPGSKTTQLASMLNNRGIILANELSASRLKSLHSNLVRNGVLNTCMSHLDARNLGQWMPGQFDFVLLDAPCGGEGTVRKDPRALVNWNLQAVTQIAKLQQELILSAYQALKPGGKLVYSTCTLSLEENHQVANYLVAQTDACVERLNELFVGAEQVTSSEGYLHVLPHIFDSEGFFVACFSKPKSASIESQPVKKYDSPFVAVSAKIKQQIMQYYRAHFGFEIITDGYQLLQRDKEVWLFPADISLINQYLKVNRAGIQLAQIFPNKIRSSHEMAVCCGSQATRQRVEISRQQASQYIQGLNISIETSDAINGEVILTYQQQVIGLGQNQKGKVKNGLPRDLVRDNLNF